VQTTKKGVFESTPLDCASNECLNKEDGEPCFNCNCACGAQLFNQTLFFRDCGPVTTTAPATPAPTPFPTPAVVCTNVQCSIAGFEALPCGQTGIEGGGQCFNNRCVDNVGTLRVNCSSNECVGKAPGAACEVCDCGCAAALNDFLLTSDCLPIPTTTSTATGTGSTGTGSTTPSPTGTGSTTTDIGLAVCGNNIIEPPEECDGTAEVVLTQFQRCDLSDCKIRSVVPLWSLLVALGVAGCCCCCFFVALAARRRRRRAQKKRDEDVPLRGIPAQSRVGRRMVA
jgi:hypothetical protein